MNPLPVGNSGMPSIGGKPMLPLPSALPSGSTDAKKKAAPRPPRANDAAPLHRAYPALLLASTTLAGVFCYLYLTKPVIAPAATTTSLPLSATTMAPQPAAQAKPAATQTKPSPALLPASDRLPGDAKPATATARHESPAKATPAKLAIPTFEETNLRVQHVLSAESPGGDLSRLVVDVPVLYRTGNLAWTEAQIAESRALLNDLSNYQEKSRELRAEGNRLLAAWNRLIASSIPTPILRADSPALPENQGQSGQTPATPDIDTTRSIQIQPSGS